MRAVQYDRYGGPEVLQVVEVPRPKAASRRAIIRMAATSVNPVETRVRSGAAKALTGWWFPKGTGLDFVGEVVETGDGWTGPGIGERAWGFIWGLPDGRALAAAEFLSVKAGWLSRAPHGTDPDVAALPLVGSTAYGALTRLTGLRRGERLLIRGASGGVGTAAVQLGRALGAHVTGLAGPRNLGFVRELGADAVLDYHEVRPESMADRFDVILDLQGTDLPAWRRLLAPGGRFATTASKGAGYTVLTQVLGTSRIRPIASFPKTADLEALAALVEAGELKPVISRRFPLEEIAAAHAAYGGATGKVLVTITG